MNELDIIQGRAYLQLTIDQLNMWNDKKPNEKLVKLVGMAVHSLAQYNGLEKEMRLRRQRTADLELKALQLAEENKQMKIQINNMTAEIELHKKEL